MKIDTIIREDNKIKIACVAGAFLLVHCLAATVTQDENNRQPEQVLAATELADPGAEPADHAKEPADHAKEPVMQEVEPADQTTDSVLETLTLAENSENVEDELLEYHPKEEIIEGLEVLEGDKPETGIEPVGGDKPETSIDPEPEAPVIADAVSFTEAPNYRSELEARYQAYYALHSDYSQGSIVMHVNIGIDQPFFTDVKTVTDTENLLILVNKYHALSADYIPSDLVQLSETYSSGSQYLKTEVAEAFELLCSDVAALGYDVKAVSAYRSYETQAALYNRYVERSGQTSADTYSARAGFSEHQTGLAVDIKGSGYPFNEFSKTKECTYVHENAHLYGFILRYPTGARFMTGYIPEAWHLRYVGVDAATEIYNMGVTYEEYCVMKGLDQL